MAYSFGDLPWGYSLCRGSTLDRSKLLKFMHLTYLELAPQGNLAHLAETVEQYFSAQTPLWWVYEKGERTAQGVEQTASLHWQSSSPIACLWVGTAIDQLQGDRHAHIFLLYVTPEHRRRGIGTALMQYAEAWAVERGDRQIGLQVFQSNRAALSLYEQLGYRAQSLWMAKPLGQKDER